MAYRYDNIEKKRISNVGKKYFVNVIYPDIPISGNDQYVMTTIGDRLDLIAYDAYKDVNLWWIIASANNLPGDSLVPPIGEQLRIPADIQSIINNYDSVNRIR
jgi:hypothetical protein